MKTGKQQEVVDLVDRIGEGQERAVDELLPLVYAELRTLARARLAREHGGDEPDATSLVHQVYVRLVGDQEYRWANRRHFFSVAAEVMRRIVIDRARRRSTDKHGGGRVRVASEEVDIGIAPRAEELMALDQALEELERVDESMARVVKLRYFGGATVPETALALELSERTVNRQWTAARAWLHDRLR